MYKDEVRKHVLASIERILKGVAAAAGIPDDEADLDARLLAEHVLGWETARFFSTAAADPEPPDFPKRYEAVVARRAARGSRERNA